MLRRDRAGYDFGWNRASFGHYRIAPARRQHRPKVAARSWRYFNSGLMETLFASQSTVTVVPSAKDVRSWRWSLSRNSWPVISNKATRLCRADIWLTRFDLGLSVSADASGISGTPPQRIPRSRFF